MTAAEAVGAYDKNFWLVHGFRISLMMMLSALDALSMVIKEKGFAEPIWQVKSRHVNAKADNEYS